MTSEHIARVADAYDAELEAACIPAVENGTRLEHARWMCGRLQDLVKDREFAKAHIWLGFIQGVLYSLKVHTIEEMRDHNRTPADQLAIQTQVTDDLVTFLDVETFPSTSVMVGHRGATGVIITTHQHDGTWRQHWLQVHDVQPVADPRAS